MALSYTTSIGPSGVWPGMGYKAVVLVVWDNSYAANGEVLDLSAVFPNEVIGGCSIADTLNDGGYFCVYERAASGAPATGEFQAYYGDWDAVADAALIEVAGTTDVSAMDGQTWMFWGR